MSSRPGTHIRVSFLTLHCDIFHLVIISSLFSDITYHHLRYSSFVFSHIIAYSTLSLFHLEWWFLTRHCMEGCHILSYHSPHGQWFRDLIWEVVLLVRIHVTSVHGESLFIWVCIFMGDHSLLIRVCTKKQKQNKKKKKMIAHYSFYHSPLGMCMDVLGCFIEFMC